MIGDFLQPEIFNVIDIDLRHPRQSMPHEPGFRVGLLQLIGNGADEMANPRRAEGFEPDGGADLPELPRHHVDAVPPPLSTHLVADPRATVPGAEHEGIVGTLRHDLAQGFDAFRPQRRGAFDGATTHHLRTGKDDQARVEIDSGTGECGAILRRVSAIHHQQNHRLHLWVLCGGTDPQDFGRIGTPPLLLSRRWLAEDGAEPRPARYPFVVLREPPASPNDLDAVSDGVCAQPRLLPPAIESGEVVRPQVAVERGSAERLDHAEQVIAVGLEFLEAEPPRRMVCLALVGVSVCHAPHRPASAVADGLGEIPAGIKSLLLRLPMAPRFIGIAFGDVVDLSLVPLLPTTPDVRGELEMGMGFDRLHPSSRSATINLPVVRSPGSFGKPREFQERFPRLISRHSHGVGDIAWAVDIKGVTSNPMGENRGSVSRYVCGDFGVFSRNTVVQNYTQEIDNKTRKAGGM